MWVLLIDFLWVGCRVVISLELAGLQGNWVA